MKRTHLRLLAAAALAVLAVAVRADDFPSALGPVFQADLPQTLARLKALPDATLSPRDRPVRECILARFAAADPAASAPVDPRLPADLAAVLRAYRRYWTSALMHRQTAAQAEAALSADLGRLLPAAPADLGARAAASVALAGKHGWHALGDVTAPLHEYLLWKSQQTRRERVALPGGTVAVSVSILAGFASLGWGAWGTCDRSHTGGWATTQGLMVVPGWDRSSERYRVSLLDHESQHFADYPRFPKLAQTDLEYRAKLTELALAHDAQADLLAMFASGAKRDRALPHPFAQWWVMKRLGDRLGGADRTAWRPDDVRAAAAAELAAHTALLQARGAATVETALPD
jgi:hypothetical protein